MSFKDGTKRAELTIDVVDVVDAHLLIIHHLPAQRKLIPHTVGKGQGLGNPTGRKRMPK